MRGVKRVILFICLLFYTGGAFANQCNLDNFISDTSYMLSESIIGGKKVSQSTSQINEMLQICNTDIFRTNEDSEIYEKLKKSGIILFQPYSKCVCNQLSPDLSLSDCVGDVKGVIYGSYERQKELCEIPNELASEFIIKDECEAPVAKKSIQSELPWITKEWNNTCQSYLDLYVPLEKPDSPELRAKFSRMSLEYITKYSYCSCGLREDVGGVITPSHEKIDSEEYIYNYKDRKLAECVSEVEKGLLKVKKDYKQEQCKELNNDDAVRLVESSIGTNCGRTNIREEDEQGSSICIKDIRLVSYDAHQDHSGGMIDGIKRWSIINKAESWNNVVHIIAFTSRVFDFGFHSFGEFPKLVSTELSDMFGGFFGLINTLALRGMAIFLLYFIAQKLFYATDESYFSLIIKLGVVLSTFFIGYFYSYLGDGVNIIRDHFIDTMGLNEQLEAVLSMKVFQDHGIVSVDWTTAIGFVFNTIILFLLSLAIVARDLFLYTLSIFVFLLSVGVMIGSSSGRDIFKGRNLGDSGLALCTKGYYYVISFMIAVFLTIVISMFSTLILATIESPFSRGYSITERVVAYGFDTFIYLCINLLILFVGFKYILPNVLKFVENKMNSIFFHKEDSVGDDSLMSSIQKGMQAGREYHNKLLSNNSSYENFINKVEDKKDYILDATEAFPVLNSVASAGFKLGTGIGLNTKKFNNEDQYIKDKLFYDSWVGNIEEKMGNLDKSIPSELNRFNKLKDDLLLAKKEQEFFEVQNMEDEKLQSNYESINKELQGVDKKLKSIDPTDDNNKIEIRNLENKKSEIILRKEYYEEEINYRTQGDGIKQRYDLIEDKDLAERLVRLKKEIRSEEGDLNSLDEAKYDEKIIMQDIQTKLDELYKNKKEIENEFKQRGYVYEEEGIQEGEIEVLSEGDDIKMNISNEEKENLVKEEEDPYGDELLKQYNFQKALKQVSAEFMGINEEEIKDFVVSYQKYIDCGDLYNFKEFGDNPIFSKIFEINYGGGEIDSELVKEKVFEIFKRIDGCKK